MPSTCTKIQKEYEQIRTLKKEFDLEYQTTIETKDLTKVKELKRKLEQAREALSNKLWVFEKLPQKELKEQYEQDKESLIKAGILEKLSNNEMGTVGIDNEEYIYPKIEVIAKQMMMDKEQLETKIEQGFIEVQITPVAQGLDKKIDVYRQRLWEHYKEKKLFATMKDSKDTPTFPNDLPFKDDTIDKIKSGTMKYEDVWKEGGRYIENGDVYNDKNKAIWVWDKYKNADIDNNLVYYPKEFNQDPDIHKGKTKMELIEETKNTAFPGYIVILRENLPNIPRTGKGEIMGNRKQLEAGKQPKEYLNTLQTDQQYKNEMGMTPDDQIIYAIQHLEKTNQTIDDWQGNGSLSYQLGAYFPAGGYVPYACWDRDDHQVSLGRSDPGSSGSGSGLRSSVRVI